MHKQERLTFGQLNSENLLATGRENNSPLVDFITEAYDLIKLTFFTYNFQNLCVLPGRATCYFGSATYSVTSILIIQKKLARGHNILAVI